MDDVTKIRPMNEDVREALEKCIIKWKANAVAKEPDDVRINRVDCALCVMFNTGAIPGGLECVGCPVFESTGEKACRGTPYENVLYIFEEHTVWNAPWKIVRKKLRKYSRKEAKFLRSLRPEEST